MNAKNLQSHIQSALNAVTSNPQGKLKIGYRQSIWMALGPFVYDVRAKDNEGYKRRALLAVMSAKHGLSLCKSMREEGDKPNQLLTQAENTVYGNLPLDALVDAMEDFWDQIEDMAGEVKDSVLYANMSVYQALEVVRVDESFDENGRIDYTTEESSETTTWDAARLAAEAHASTLAETGASQEMVSAKRREFWVWWLTEAVPKAKKAF